MSNNSVLLDSFMQNNIINNNNKLDWDTYFMAQALLASKRSSCERLHVGCVIVINNRIVTTGYNGFLKGSPHTSRVVNGHEQGTIHAEQNAICDAACRGVPLKDSIAFVTHMPCLICFKLLVASGVKEVKYLSDYKNDPLVKEIAVENCVRLIKLNL